MSSDFFLDDKWTKKLDQEAQRIFDRDGLDRKTVDKVFDKSTLLTLGKLISDGVIDTLDFPISTGKEAVIFRGITPNKKLVAVKIYCTSSITFKHISKYIVGDPRFKYSNKNRREVIFEWAKKEFKNLERLKEAQVRAPHPIKRINNVLVMQYIGSFKQPAPLLKDVPLQKPEKIYDILIDYIFKMYHKASLVHADLSEYNVLMYRQKPYIIDLGQGVVLEHPLSQEFLRRDIHNIIHFFRRFGITDDENTIFTTIVKKRD